MADSNLTSLRDLHSRREALEQRRATTQSHDRKAGWLGVVAMLLSPAVWFLSAASFNPFRWTLLLVTYGVIFSALSFLSRARLRTIEADMQELDFQIGLQHGDMTRNERRAEKILRGTDSHLRRYDELHRNQNVWIFSLGVFCIALGVSMIAGTLYLVLHVAPTPEAQIITAMLGGLGALFPIGIAALSMKMHTTASGNLVSFHTKLVETNRLLLANLLASRIEENDTRHTPLADKAAGLVRPSSDQQDADG